MGEKEREKAMKERTKKIIVTALAGVIISGCHRDTRVRIKPSLKMPTRTQQVTKQQRLRTWETMAKILKSQHPEWKESVAEIVAEFEYQWMLQQKR